MKLDRRFAPFIDKTDLSLEDYHLSQLYPWELHILSSSLMLDAAGFSDYTALHPRKWLPLTETLSVIFKNFNLIICGFHIMENSTNP